ncbi:MAG TPA: type II toxin-antitoxin system VapC family toxin [Rhizomicrobium sp.]
MKIAADANLLIRVVVEDDPRQAKIAQAELQNADVVAIGISALCELAWVLTQRYHLPSASVAAAIRAFAASANVIVNRPAVDAGLAILDAGGDFADGVIAFEGRQLGGETFVSSDKQAVKLLRASGVDARQP